MSKHTIETCSKPVKVNTKKSELKNRSVCTLVLCVGSTNNPIECYGACTSCQSSHAENQALDTSLLQLHLSQATQPNLNIGKTFLVYSLKSTDV